MFTSRGFKRERDYKVGSRGKAGVHFRGAGFGSVLPLPPLSFSSSFLCRIILFFLSLSFFFLFLTYLYLRYVRLSSPFLFCSFSPPALISSVPILCLVFLLSFPLAISSYLLCLLPFHAPPPPSLEILIFRSRSAIDKLSDCHKDFYSLRPFVSSGQLQLACRRRRYARGRERRWGAR